MPPPKRPKSEVVWTTLCTDAESGVQEQSCCNVDDSFRAVWENVQDVDDAVAMLNDSLSTPRPKIVVSTVSCESPLDLRRTDADDRLDTGDATGSRRPTSATTLRRLLLEPMTPASDRYRSTSSPATATSVAVAAYRQCQPTVVTQCRTSVCTQLTAVPYAADRTRQTDNASSRSLPAAALRRILLTVDDYNDVGSNHPQPPVTTRLQQSNFVRLDTSGSGLDRSPSSAASGVARRLPSFSASDARNVSRTTSSLSRKYALLTGRLECRDSVVSEEESTFTEQRRETSNSLK